MESFADQLKRLRKNKGDTLRVVSRNLGIDQAILSKIENGKRQASREVVIKLSSYYKVTERDLLTSWLSDKLLYEVGNDDLALDVLNLAEEKIAYRKTPKLTREKIIEIIRDFLAKDGRVSKAWIFGSFARGDYNAKSDIDLMVRFINIDKTTLFDFADITYLLEEKLNIKIDLVEEGYLQSFALKTAQKDLKIIYE